MNTANNTAQNNAADQLVVGDAVAQEMPESLNTGGFTDAERVRQLAPDTRTNPLKDPTGALTPVEMDSPLMTQNAAVQYAVSALRPNVVTSTAYSMAFIKGINANYISIDRNRDLGKLTVKQMRDFIATIEEKQQKLEPGSVVSVEIGGDIDDQVVSLRFTSFAANFSKFHFLVLFNPSFAVVYYTDYTEVIHDIREFLKTEEPKELPAITRVDLGGQGVQFSKIHLKKNEPIIDAFYPQVLYRTVDGADQYYGMKALLTDYFAARPSVLTMMGEWGCGKSTLMRMIANEFREGREFFIIEDIALYQSSQAFTEVINKIREVNVEGKQAVVFLEEADPFLQQKTMDNSFLARFLSSSDGATNLDVKFVLAMNQSNEKHIDHSVLRTGRSFATIGFSKFTSEQANAARKAIGLEEVEFNENVTLAEALGEERRIFGHAKLEGTKAPLSIGFGTN